MFSRPKAEGRCQQRPVCSSFKRPAQLSAGPPTSLQQKPHIFSTNHTYVNRMTSSRYHQVSSPSCSPTQLLIFCALATVSVPFWTFFRLRSKNLQSQSRTLQGCTHSYFFMFVLKCMLPFWRQKTQFSSPSPYVSCLLYSDPDIRQYCGNVTFRAVDFT